MKATRLERRQHPVWADVHDAWHRLNESEWLTDFKYGLITGDRQLTRGRQTNLYVLLDEDTRAVKIGVAANVRARWTNAQVGNPRALAVLAFCPGTLELEQYIHDYLRDWRLRGEWFALSPEVLSVVELIASAEDIAEDVNKYADEGQGADAGYSVGAMYFWLDQALSYPEGLR